ncbi:L-histidine N(alpha)-methyltransferase [Methylocella sp.]|uniref:L-histidine N(alpha)-methyltransferase n=1 Tax=Methylocella sp. TaxID=1978226 RepID=UPI0037844AEA
MLDLLENDGPGRAAIPDADASEALAGLSAPRKWLPSRLFYDARGSALFEEITRLPEYYLTRVETRILEDAAPEIAQATPPGALLVEYGSGSSRKTEILIEALPKLLAYAPIDVSPDALADAAARLKARFPALRVAPAAGDFHAALRLPADLENAPRLGFFPGSTIGNFAPDDAKTLLAHMRRGLGAGGRLILGVDLMKDAKILIPAYDDAQGVTAAFNLNILARLNRDFGADFDLGGFRHEARLNARESRMEMHLVSLRPQRARLLGHVFDFAAGETIHTENSYKYAAADFAALARAAGWTPLRQWSDPQALFSVHELVAA